MKTKIGWCDHSLNPGIFGCSPKSAECLNCYAAKMAHRQVAMGNYPEGITEKTKNGVRWTGKVILGSFDHVWLQFAGNLPTHKKVRVFVTSMADLFHEKVTWEFIHQVYRMMADYQNCTFMVLTKWPERLLEFQMLARDRDWRYLLDNVYHGITGGTQTTFDERWNYLRLVESPKLFVSAEPLLSNIVLPKELLDLGDRLQMIWGGERDHNARPMKPEWARGILDQCWGTGIKRYFKQWGTFLPHSQRIPGVHMSEDEDLGYDDHRFIKVTGAGSSDILDGQTFHEHLELA